MIHFTEMQIIIKKKKWSYVGASMRTSHPDLIITITVEKLDISRKGICKLKERQEDGGISDTSTARLTPTMST